MSVKRDPSNPDSDNSGGMFGSNVPPFPYTGEELNQHYGPPGIGNTYIKNISKIFLEIVYNFLKINLLYFYAAYSRMTPPGGRPNSVPAIPVPNHHQMHGVSFYFESNLYLFCK